MNGGALILHQLDLSACCWALRLTIRPLEASSGRVMVAGVVRRLRALVSCNITASMSCSETKQSKSHTHLLRVAFMKAPVVL